MRYSNSSIYYILLVEDEASHVEIARRNLIDTLVPHRLIHVEDGQAALDYLHRDNEFSDFESYAIPDLILLDLHLPKVHGLEVLRRIQANKNLSKIPTVVLTTSAAPSDIDIVYGLGATGYQIKPISARNLKSLLGILFPLADLEPSCHRQGLSSSDYENHGRRLP